MSNNETLQVRARPFASRKVRPFPKRKTGKKGGRLFFSMLIFFSGIVVVFLSVCTVYQKEVGIFLFKQMVIDRAFSPLLLENHSQKEREAIHLKLDDFYALAQAGGLEDKDLERVNTYFHKILLDQRIEKEEVQSLLALMKRITETEGSDKKDGEFL